MRARSGRRTTTRGRIGSAILATIVASMALVSVTSSTSSAAPVNATINTSCGARNNDPDTIEALNQAQLLIGSNRVKVTLNITANDIPANAGLDEEIDARFKVSARLDQALIDGAAGLIPSIPATNLSGTLLVNGPSSVDSFTAKAPNTSITPVEGRPANIDMGTFGGPITTTGGGIITYRVGTLDFDSSLSVPAPINLSFNLKLRCTVQGSNLIARTTVRDPDAPNFNPEVIALEATGGETVNVDLLNDVITEGKTPLLPESLEIVEQPGAGSASISGGVFSFQAPNEPGTYSTTVQVCGAPKPDSGIPGVSEVQTLALGDNWAAQDTGGLTPRPIAFTLKVGEEETAQIETYTLNALGFLNPPSTNRTPENWAPETRAGLVGDYVLTTNFRRPTAAAIQSALEALPSIGAGNVEVTDVRNESDRLTGFEVTYVNERAEQNIGAISVGQWYAVPPQEALDRINLAITGALGGGDDEEGEEPDEGPTGPLAALIAGPPELDPTDPAAQQIVDTYMQQKILAGLTDPAAGPTSDDWDTWADFRILQPLIGAITSAAPEILAFLSSLFPTVLAAETTTEGEEATPPQPLCAQGIIDVTVAEVAAAVDDGPGADVGSAVAGQTALPGAQPSFVG